MRHLPISKVSLLDILDVDAEGALHHVDLEPAVCAGEGEASGDAKLGLVAKELLKTQQKGCKYMSIHEWM